MGLTQLEFKKGFAEELPVPDASVDVVISNGVINLTPDK
jgi:ubiquinone/menaquinone biosynthesis C-methylase UbiE